MSIRVGVRVDQARVERTRGPGREVGTIPRLARRCEAVGVDAFFLRPAQARPRLDPFVILGACAARTSTVLLGCLASPALERSPSVLAKVATGLDVCSNGRAVCVLSPSGCDLSSFEQVGEALEVVRAMVRLPSPSVSGRHYGLRLAWNEPKARRGDDATPIGLLIDRAMINDDAGADSLFAPGLIELAARFVEYCFVEERVPAVLESLALSFRERARQGGRIPGTSALVGIVSADAILPAGEIERHVQAYQTAGYDGIVLDWNGLPTDTVLLGRLEMLVATVASW